MRTALAVVVAVFLLLNVIPVYIRLIGFGDAAANLKWQKQPHWIQTISSMSDLNSRIKAGESLNYGQALQLIPDPMSLAR
jgi:hypothetical protein